MNVTRPSDSCSTNKHVPAAAENMIGFRDVNNSRPNARAAKTP
jgi:hypothetical protein